MALFTVEEEKCNLCHVYVAACPAEFQCARIPPRKELRVTWR